MQSSIIKENSLLKQLPEEIENIIYEYADDTEEKKLAFETTELIQTKLLSLKEFIYRDKHYPVMSIHTILGRYGYGVPEIIVIEILHRNIQKAVALYDRWKSEENWIFTKRPLLTLLPPPVGSKQWVDCLDDIAFMVSGWLKEEKMYGFMSDFLIYHTLVFLYDKTEINFSEFEYSYLCCKYRPEFMDLWNYVSIDHAREDWFDVKTKKVIPWKLWLKSRESL